MTTAKANLVFSYPNLYCTGKYTPMKIQVIKSMSTNSFMLHEPNPGIIKVSIPYIRQQATYVTMQKIYLDKTIILRGYGVAHNSVAALGN